MEKVLFFSGAQACGAGALQVAGVNEFGGPTQHVTELERGSLVRETYGSLPAEATQVVLIVVL